MHRVIFRTACAFALLAPALANAQRGGATARPLRPITMTASTGPRVFTNDHVGTFNGQRVRYQTKFSEIVVNSPADRPAVSIFSTAYLGLGVDRATRPVIFVFNGGPGGSSSPMHFTSMGPKMLERRTPDVFRDTTLKLVDNPVALLDVADLVFLDPPETGWSALHEGIPVEAFHSVDADAEACAAMIIRWLQDNGRMASPVYVHGESYGTMRAVALARDLARSTPPVYLNGVVLGGQAITYGVNRDRDPVRPAQAVVTLAGIAWYHGKIDNKNQTADQAIEKARQFARNEYAPALLMGYRIDSATNERIIRKLPSITGIPEAYFRQHGIRSMPSANTEMLRDRGLVLDRNDGRFTMPAPPPGGRQGGGGGGGGNAYAAFEAAIRRYAAGALKVTGFDRRYLVIAPSRGWDFTTAGAPALDTTLARVTHAQPDLRVLVLQGRFDALTTVGSTEHTIGQTNIPQHKLTFIYYDGGHFLEPDSVMMAGYRRWLTGVPKARAPLPN